MAVPAWVVPAAIAVGTKVIDMAQGWRARKVNENYVRQQNAYNSPSAQMARFKSAGLNPNLVYSQGNPGNQSTTLSQPEGLQNSGSGAVAAYNQSSLAQSQVSANQQRIQQSKAVTEVNRLQAEVLRKNPLLNDAGFEAVIDALVATAIEKEANATTAKQRAEWATGEKAFSIDGVELHGPAGAVKLETELKLLQQRFNLGQADQEIKAEVLNSKEFQNAILNVQKKFLEDAEISPQHILDFVKILLMKIK